MTDEMIISLVEQFDRRLTEIIRQLERINANLAPDGSLAAIRQEERDMAAYAERATDLRKSVDVKYLAGRWPRKDGDGFEPKPPGLPHDDYPNRPIRPPGVSGD